MSDGSIPPSGVPSNSNQHPKDGTNSSVSSDNMNAASSEPASATSEACKAVTPDSSTYLLKDPKLKEILLSDVGVETLLSRLKQSIFTVKEVSIYIKKMATIETEHSSHLKKVSRLMNDAFKRPEIKKGTCQNQVLNMMRSTDRYGDAGVTFIDTMHKIHDELNELVRSMDRARKVNKETALRHEKTLIDAEREVEKAKAKYDTSCEELEKARTSDPNKSKLGFKNKSEDELHRRMTIAEVDYQQKVDNCRRIREELVSKLRVDSVHKLQGLVLECDNALSLQLLRFSNLFETLQLNRGFVIAPLKPQNSQASANQSIKEMASKIDSELDFYNFVCSIAKSKNSLNRPTVTFKKHPALGPAKPNKATPAPAPVGSQAGSTGTGGSAGMSSPAMGGPRNFNNQGFNNQGFNSQGFNSQGINNYDRKASASSTVSKSSQLPAPSMVVSSGTAKTGPVLAKSPMLDDPRQTQMPGPPTPQIPSQAPAAPQVPSQAPKATQTPQVPHISQPPQVQIPQSQIPQSQIPHGSMASPAPSNELTPVQSIPSPVYDPSKHGLPVYGTPLEDLLDYEEGTVPRVVYQCVQAIDNFGLEVEGIYRLNGNKDQVAAIRQEFDVDAAAVDLLRPKDGVNDIHSVASALKQYFHSLPDSLLTQEFHQQFINAAKIPDEVNRRDSIHAVINNLPDPNYTTLRYLVFHLFRVQERSGINKMDVTNLGIVWGPVLMKSEFNDVGEMAVESRAVQTIIANAYAIFEAE